MSHQLLVKLAENNLCYNELYGPSPPCISKSMRKDANPTLGDHKRRDSYIYDIIDYVGDCTSDLYNRCILRLY